MGGHGVLDDIGHTLQAFASAQAGAPKLLYDGFHTVVFMRLAGSTLLFPSDFRALAHGTTHAVLHRTTHKIVEAVVSAISACP
jgi:hypothetical protein